MSNPNLPARRNPSRSDGGGNLSPRLPRGREVGPRISGHPARAQALARRQALAPDEARLRGRPFELRPRHGRPPPRGSPHGRRERKGADKVGFKAREDYILKKGDATLRRAAVQLLRFSVSSAASSAARSAVRSRGSPFGRSLIDVFQQRPTPML